MNDILFIDPGHAFGVENRMSPFILDNFHVIDMYESRLWGMTQFLRV